MKTHKGAVLKPRKETYHDLLEEIITYHGIRYLPPIERDKYEQYRSLYLEWHCENIDLVNRWCAEIDYHNRISSKQP